MEANYVNLAGKPDLLPLSGSATRPPRAAAAGDEDDGPDRESDPAQATVTALYQIHARGLIRLAVIMLGSRQAAEDVVQDAFCGLYRRWNHLANPDKALGYVRSAVLNGCRSELRRQARAGRRRAQAMSAGDAVSAEYAVLLSEEHREVILALRRLPARQREALVLRFFMDLPERDVARSMGVSQGTVKSTTSRALAALAKNLKENA